jgi:hypothetical protein
MEKLSNEGDSDSYHVEDPTSIHYDDREIESSRIDRKARKKENYRPEVNSK